MELTFLINAPLWVINLALGGLIYARAPRKASHQAFAMFVLGIVIWSFCVKAVYAYAAHPSGIVWGRVSFAAGSIIGSSFAVFCQVFPDHQHLALSRGARVFILLGALVTGLSLTPWVQSAVGVRDTGHFQAHYGPLYPVYGSFVLAAFGHGIWTLAGKWRIAHGRSKMQMQYLWLGLGLGIGGAVTTNLIIPALTHDSRFGKYGPYFSLFLVGSTAHAIIRHRLMDIRLVIRQSITYLLSLSATVGIMWGVLIIVSTAVDQQLRTGEFILPLLMGLGGVVIFLPIRMRAQRLLDQYCYRDPYDYGQATRVMSRVMASLMRLQPLCDYLTTFILTTLKVEAVAVYVCREHDELERYTAQTTEDDRQLPHTLSTPEVMRLMTCVGAPIVRDELEFWPDNDAAAHLAEAFASLQSDVIIPLLVENKVAAVISVGGKMSGDPFFTHDLELLSTVGHQASVALRRAQLYEEVTWMKEYNEGILRRMQSGVIAVSQKGVITMMNAAAAHLIQVEATEVTGSSVAEVLPEALREPLRHSLAGTTMYTNQEVSVRLATGRTLPIAISTSVLHGTEGELTGAILVFHDLSRLKQLEEEKRRIERLASVGAFVSGIAHEIKNPLVAIKTFAELLPEQYDDAEFRDTFTQVALHEVERIDTLVRRLRSMGSSSSLQMRPVNILTPLDETLALLSGELSTRHITLVYEAPKPLPTILGDHNQLKQVFLNLCLNSVEAMEKDGILRITVRLDDIHDDTPALMLVEIADTGPGIPAEYLPTIFEPFVTSKDTGSGLGLAICKGIVDYHRGMIQAANCPHGPGAIFTVKLPVAQGEDRHEVIAPDRRYQHPAESVA
jgi:PAS domain S-box-containing protein